MGFIESIGGISELKEHINYKKGTHTLSVKESSYVYVGTEAWDKLSENEKQTLKRHPSRSWNAETKSYDPVEYVIVKEITEARERQLAKLDAKEVDLEIPKLKLRLAFALGDSALSTDYDVIVAFCKKKSVYDRLKAKAILTSEDYVRGPEQLWAPPKTFPCYTAYLHPIDGVPNFYRTPCTGFGYFGETIEDLEKYLGFLNYQGYTESGRKRISREELFKILSWRIPDSAKIFISKFLEKNPLV